VGHALWGAIVYAIVFGILVPLILWGPKPFLFQGKWDVGSFPIAALLPGAIGGALIRGVRAYHISCAKENGAESIQG
jgi:hypothetical protein